MPQETTEELTPEELAALQSQEENDETQEEEEEEQEDADDVETLKEELAAAKAREEKWKTRFKKGRAKIAKKGKEGDDEPEYLTKEDILAIKAEETFKQEHGDDVFDEVSELAESKGLSLDDAYIIYDYQKQSDPQYIAKKNAKRTGLHGNLGTGQDSDEMTNEMIKMAGYKVPKKK